MKKYIIILSTILIAFTSCKKDFLEVKSDSKYEGDYVFGNKEEINRVLTAVYTSLLSNDSYGNAFLSTFALNSDVEFTAFAGEMASVNGEDFKAFDGAKHATSILSFWNKQYEGIERANIFIEGIQSSPVYKTSDKDLTQMLGEAKVLRAMFYHDLVVMYGDVPFDTIPAMKQSSFEMPVTNRNEILSFLIKDLKEAASGMKYAKDLPQGVERVSKEFCFGMIARMALTRGGYALYPDGGIIGTMKRMPDYKDYYGIAMQYADSAISSNTHALAKSFRNVFIDECNNIVNNGDDPIFEIPFLKNSSSNIGYVTGPAVSSTNGLTIHNWGASNGGMRLNAFYPYSFDTSDLRQQYTVGYWNYDAAGVPQFLNDYSLYNNKWSKLWADVGMGPGSSGGTGINYPYMRYADILLMYAEAVNEVEEGVGGPNGAKAINAFKQVRRRAFASADQAQKVETYTAMAAASKESFFNAIANERKWEFGGENIRWKDLVRWNLYSKVVYDSFKEYYIVASMVGGDYIEGYDKYQTLPTDKFYKRIANPGNKDVYPNTSTKFQIMTIFNPWKIALNPGSDWLSVRLYNWYNTDNAIPNNQILYSFRGFIKGGPTGNWESLDRNNLPPVRYILPIPQQAIQMSNGNYNNQYGYN